MMVFSYCLSRMLFKYVSENIYITIILLPVWSQFDNNVLLWQALRQKMFYVYSDKCISHVSFEIKKNNEIKYTHMAE